MKSFGEEPLLLDQLEDDLDNVLIYDLIVKQLRQISKTSDCSHSQCQYCGQWGCRDGITYESP